jgi:hypothetical protein
MTTRQKPCEPSEAESNIETAIRQANVLAEEAMQASGTRLAVVVWDRKAKRWKACHFHILRPVDHTLEFLILGQGKHPIPCNETALEVWLSLVRSKQQAKDST